MTTTVWTGRGVSPREGTLTLNAGRLRFELDGKVAFDLPVNHLSISWPWYGFGCQFWARTGDRKDFISFLHTGNTLSSWWTGVQLGHRWKRAMSMRW